MDLPTADNHRIRLQKELDAFRNQATVLSYAPMLMATEVDRLKVEVKSEAWRFFAEGSEVKIPVENESLVPQLSKDFGLTLTDISSLERFKAKLVSELPEIEAFPLISQFTQRVIELLEEEISRQLKNIHGEISLSSAHSAARSRFYLEELNESIKDAITTVIERNQQGATADQVLDILRENHEIEIDDYVRSTLRQRFFEETFALDRTPAFLN